jgi:hypothetical protein
VKGVKRVVHIALQGHAPAGATMPAKNGGFMQAILDGIFTVPGDGTVDFRRSSRS